MISIVRSHKPGLASIPRYGSDGTKLLIDDDDGKLFLEIIILDVLPFLFYVIFITVYLEQ